MKNFKSLLATFCLILSGIALSCFPSYALTWDLNGGDILVGANDVSVGELFYDVQFVDNTGYNLFYNESSWNFTFQAPDEAHLASLALLDDVLIDESTAGLPFDTEPWLTYGIGDANYCDIYTPYEYDNITDESGNVAEILRMSFIHNSTNEYQDFRSYCVLGIDIDTVDYANIVYAIWTPAPVPEPSTILLMGLGLASLVVIRVRKRS